MLVLGNAVQEELQHEAELAQERVCVYGRHQNQNCSHPRELQPRQCHQEPHIPDMELQGLVSILL